MSKLVVICDVFSLLSYPVSVSDQVDRDSLMVHTAKQVLRQQIRQLLKSMSPEDRLRQSSRVTERVLHHPKYLTSHRISVYVHMPTEISTRELIQDAFRSNKQVFIPRYNVNTMEMVRIYSIEDLDSLPKTKWNIQQPSFDDKDREIADRNIDLVLVPGLAFSMDGARLGHGKGFYDRYLKTVSEHTYTIGLAFRQQLLEINHIPMSETDVRLNEILLDNSV